MSNPVTERRGMRIALIGASLVYMLLFLVLPVVTVFVEALRRGAA